jgi:flagellar motor switch protein FliN
MAELTAEQIEQIVEACRAQLTAVSDTFHACLDCALRLSFGEQKPYALEAIAAWEGPGLAVSLVVGEQGLVLLIPEPIPLPNWYRQPSISENNRLQSFAQELSLQVVPADLGAERYFATYAANLQGFAEQTQIEPTARLLEIAAYSVDAAEMDPPLATIAVIVPARFNVAALDEAIQSQAAAASMESEEDAANPDLGPGGMPDLDSPPDATSPETGLSLDQALRALRIMNVPVTISVRLAERKMPLGQIVALVPGALVPFNKSCEDLLDLFVNNYRYCQGEAIKIGENFGLKIAHIAASDNRE